MGVFMRDGVEYFHVHCAHGYPLLGIYRFGVGNLFLPFCRNACVDKTVDEKNKRLVRKTVFYHLPFKTYALAVRGEKYFFSENFTQYFPFGGVIDLYIANLFSNDCVGVWKHASRVPLFQRRLRRY